MSAATSVCVSQSQSRARSWPLSFYVCTGLACVCDKINAGGVCGCLCHGTPFATYDCSFRRPSESGFSVVSTSFVVRLRNGNIYRHQILHQSSSCQVISCQVRPRHVRSGNVRRDSVSRETRFRPTSNLQPILKQGHPLRNRSFSTTKRFPNSNSKLVYDLSESDRHATQL